MLAFWLVIAGSWIIADARISRFGGGTLPSPITSLTFGTPWAYNTPYPPQTVTGDAWMNTWSNDDKIYTVSNDTATWNNTGAPNNVLLSTLSTTDSTTVGTLVNQMTPWCCGNTGSPPRSYKINGLISIAGNLYAIAYRLDPNWLTTIASNDGILLKATDHSNFLPQPPSAGQPYAAGSIMWPGTNMPFGFVQYGKDYNTAIGPGGISPHNSANYVYATVQIGGSGSGALPIQNLGQMRLARVPVGAIGNQLASDWQYWQGGDGMNSANWGSSITTAANVLDVRDAVGGRAGTAGGMQYLPRYDRYLYLGVEFLSTASPLTNSVLLAYICDAPWSCNSTPIASKHFIPQGYYLPGIMPKSLVNGGQSLVTTTAGDSTTYNSATGYYTLTYVPITLTP